MEIRSASYSEFRKIDHIPALHNGEQITLDTELINASLMNTDIITTRAIGMQPGETASMCVKACFEGNPDCYISVYLG